MSSYVPPDGQLEPRRKIRFDSGGTSCAAWHYPATSGAIVVMAAGFGVTKEPGTHPFARRFQAAGFDVLAFDYRHLGESGGRPRQLVRMGEQLADWRAAIACAAALPGGDPARVAIWGMSSSGGHVIPVAAEHPWLAAAVAQTPLVDGPAAARHTAPHQSARGTAGLVGRAVLDGLGSMVGRPPLLVPLAGPPGTVAMVTTPDGADGDRALDPDHRYPEWIQAVAARSVLGMLTYRPGRLAPRVRCPLLVVVADDDQSTPPEAAVRAAERAPRGEVVRLPGGHYSPFLASHEAAVEAEIAFLTHHLMVGPVSAHLNA